MFAEKKLHFNNLLERMGLSTRADKLITVTEVLSVNINSAAKQEVDEKDYPWAFLQKLCAGNYKARDMHFALSDLTQSSNTMYTLENLDIVSGERISPLDLFLVIYSCCDPMLKELIVKNLYLSKIAVPFITEQLFSSVSAPLVSVWPLRRLVIEGKVTQNADEASRTEFKALDLQSTMVTFARLGRPSFSKSKLLNFVLHQNAYNTFYNFECTSGTVKRNVSDGYVEIFWLPTVKDDKGNFSSPLSFLNVRGDLRMHFCENVSPILSQITDIFVMVVEIKYLLQSFNEVQNIVKNYRYAILILYGPLDSKDVHKVNSLKEFDAFLRNENPNSTIHIVLTHKYGLETNMFEVANVILNQIETFQKDIDRQTLEHRLSILDDDAVKIDETEESCVEGKRLAKDVIESMGTQQDAPLKWKKIVTPAHSLYSRCLGDKIRKIRREQDKLQIERLRLEMNNLRAQQMQSITVTIKRFAGHLVSKAESPSCLRYFLAWLSILIQVEKRKVLPKLIKENRTAWAKMSEMKSKSSSNSEDIEFQRRYIKNTENKIEEASFSIELLFRELGHIYDTIITLNMDSSSLALPSVENMEDVCALLFVEGNTIELIDGDAFYMPEHWIGRVFKKVSKIIGTPKVLTVSFLGVQSSGKSTLLNTMFGSQFPVSVGRCTKGIQMKLIPLSIDNPFQSLLILETEGLRAPDVSDGKYDFGNQLATIITGLGDITVMNVMGENAMAIRDILQVVVHAFLRLKIAESKIDLRKRCTFIHHNVSSVMALDKMRPSVSKLIEILDSVTKDAAEMEGISDILEFNQIIQFDMASQVWFLPNLWEGCPPISRINSEYSSQAADIKNKLLQIAVSDTEKSYGSLNNIIMHTRDLWKGVLTEDFVFYFRNSEEIRAFNCLENEIQHLLSEMQCFFQEQCIEISLKEFAKCSEQHKLEEATKAANELISDRLQNKIQEVWQGIELFFDTNEFKNSVLRWKDGTAIRFECTCNDLVSRIKKETDKYRLKRSIEIFQTSNCIGHEDKLHEKSMELAKRAKDLSMDEIEKQFEIIWQEFVEEIKIKPQLPTASIFKQRLREMYARDEKLLIVIDRQSFKSRKSVSAQMNLSELLKESLNFYFKNIVQVENALKSIERIIQKYITSPYSIDKEKIISFLEDVQKAIECKISWKNERLKTKTKLEILVEVCCYSSRLFDKHNLDPRTQHSEKISKMDVHNYLYQLFASDKPIVGQEINQITSVVTRLSFNNIKLSAADISIPHQFQFPFVNKVSDMEKKALVRPHVETIFSNITDDIDEMCFTDTELSDSNIKSVLYRAKKSIENLKKHKNEFTLTNKFSIRMCVYVSEYAYDTFQKHNKLYQENISKRLNKYKQSVRAQFDAHLSDRMQEDTAALLLSNEIDTIAREALKFHMPNRIAFELFRKIPASKLELITDMLTDMAEAGNFFPFIEYIQCPAEWAKIWIQDKSEKYLFAEYPTTYFKIASQTVSYIFEDIYIAIAATTKSFISDPATLETWIERVNKILKHCQILEESIRNLRRETIKIQDVTNFEKILVGHLKMLEDVLRFEASQETEAKVKWASFNPYKKVFKSYWGCKEQCAYCGEPCIKNENHEKTSDKHMCVQHRPGCCSGICDKDSKKASTETCNFNVQNPDKTHNCLTFHFACNRSEGKPCKKDTMHLFKDYQKYLPYWDIEPAPDMLESSEFWMWFVATYKTQLADYYDYDVSEIPKSWHQISKDSALKSLRRKISL